MSGMRVAEALEGEHGKDQQRIAEVGMAWLDQLLRKNHDYGSTVWDTPALAPDLPASDAILVRMSDKVSRLANLRTTNAEVSDETIEDTMGDLGGYALLYLARPKTEGATHGDSDSRESGAGDESGSPERASESTKRVGD